MTYEQTLEYLYTTLPMFSRIGDAAYKKDLTNTLLLCEALGNPQHKFKSIHIAGTNGKGSTSSMLAAVLQQSGFRTGIYTSPHIKDFGERIKVNGEMVDEAFIISFVERTKELCEKIKPSFFELTVAMAFDYFALKEVDIAVIECGMGGRLDSTNIITPILSIITNIGYDHMSILGNTLQAIASEKAGIIKENIPVVIGEYLPETKELFQEKAKEKDAAIHFAQEEYHVRRSSLDDCLHVTVVKNKGSITLQYDSDLTGLYQAKNICTCLSAIDVLCDLGMEIPHQSVRYALAHVQEINGLMGRWEKLQDSPVVIYDVSHNEDGIKQVMLQLAEQYPQRHFHFVLGFAADKDVQKVLPLFPRDADYYFTNAHIPRAMKKEILYENALAAGLNGHMFEQPAEALKAAIVGAGLKDVVIACGSFFLISELPYDK